YFEWMRRELRLGLPDVDCGAVRNIDVDGEPLAVGVANVFGLGVSQHRKERREKLHGVVEVANGDRDVIDRTMEHRANPRGCSLSASFLACATSAIAAIAVAISASASTQTRTKTRALVLGGGGPVGEAWESGIIATLMKNGVDLRGADMIVGTSAGAIVG